MIINTKIKEMFKEISDKSIDYCNSHDEERKYLKKLLNVFKTSLTEDEQLYVFKLIVEQIHFKHIITDPDNMLQLNNIKLRTYFFIFILSIGFLIIAAILFKVNDSLNGILEVFSNIMKILSL